MAEGPRPPSFSSSGAAALASVELGGQMPTLRAISRAGIAPLTRVASAPSRKRIIVGIERMP